MYQQVPINMNALAGQRRAPGVYDITTDVAYQRLGIVNVQFYGAPGAGDRQWVLIDAGLPGTAAQIRATAEQRYGASARPAAIVLTHAHFDHVGALKELAHVWDAPIYAHPLEHPFLTGRSSYPPPNLHARGGMMVPMARFYPRGPVDVQQRLHALPDDHTVPHMPGWRWIATPGHTPGHISLWRESDRLLIAGDAVITTRQESLIAVAVQYPEIHGPPMYFTPDWSSARSSVQQLASLNPSLLVTGHGPALRGDAIRPALHTLARDFNRIAVPS